MKWPERIKIPGRQVSKLYSSAGNHVKICISKENWEKWCSRLAPDGYICDIMMEVSWQQYNCAEQLTFLNCHSWLLTMYGDWFEPFERRVDSVGATYLSTDLQPPVRREIVKPGHWTGPWNGLWTGVRTKCFCVQMISTFCV